MYRRYERDNNSNRRYSHLDFKAMWYILILILMLQFRCRRSGHPGQRPTANIRASLCPCSCRTFETVVVSTSLSHTNFQDIVHFKVLNPCVVRSICVSQFRARQGTCSISSLPRKNRLNCFLHAQDALLGHYPTRCVVVVQHGGSNE